jgi:ornithine carbamoyltransferase
MKHFLKETDFARSELPKLFALAAELKRKRGLRGAPTPLKGQTWAMIFSKSSTRTRVSFEVGIHELGGNPLFLNKNDIQLGRGESVEDTARVLSRFVHGLVVRTFDHGEVERLAAAGAVPVINALTDFLHPCQIFADALTMAERWAKGATGAKLVGSLQGRKIAFLGDTACNMANSWVLGANLFGMKISLAGPKGFEPAAEFRAQLARENFPGGGSFQFTTDPLGGAGRGRGLYRRVGEHGQGGGDEGAHPPDVAVCGDGKNFRRGQARRAVHALPAGARGRGSDAGGAG